MKQQPLLALTPFAIGKLPFVQPVNQRQVIRACICYLYDGIVVASGHLRCKIVNCVWSLPSANYIWMPRNEPILVSAIVAILGYAIFSAALIQPSIEMLSLIAWTLFPLVPPLLAILISRSRKARLIAAGVLSAVLVFGLFLLSWGFVNEPDDFSLVVIFAPIYQSVLLIFLTLMLGLVLFFRRLFN